VETVNVKKSLRSRYKTRIPSGRATTCGGHSKEPETRRPENSRNTRKTQAKGNRLGAKRAKTGKLDEKLKKCGKKDSRQKESRGTPEKLRGGREK